MGLPLGADVLAQSVKKNSKAAAESPDAAKKDTAGIQRAYAAGTKAYEAGDMAGAEQQLTVALAGGGLPNSQMARALYLRGAAYRKLGRPAQAISDLTTAVWLKGGLSDTDKTKATEERQLAYREAGLGETPPPIGAAPLDAPKTATPTAPTPAAGAQIVQVTEQSFWSNFSMPSLTGGSSQPAQAAQPAPSGTATVQTADSGQQSSGFWSFLSPGSSQQPAPQPAASGTLSQDVAAPAGTQVQAPAPVTDTTPVEQTSSWTTQTAEAPAAQQLATGYAPAADTAPPNPISGTSPAADSGTSNPLAGTGTAVSNFFGNMFGSSTSNAQSAPSGPSVTTGSTEHGQHWGPETTVVTAQTSSMVQRGPDSPPPAAADELPWGTAGASNGSPASAPVKVAASGGAGKYKLQVAAVRSREEAEKLAQTLHGYQQVKDGTVAPEIDEAVIGSMGTFYRVRLGPYADAKEPGQLCKTLKPQGFDCLVVTQ